MSFSFVGRFAPVAREVVPAIITVANPTDKLMVVPT